MVRFFGRLKVALVLAVDFFIIYSLFKSYYVAALVVGLIGLYALFGGYPVLWKARAIRSYKLPEPQRKRLETARMQLIAEANAASGVNISRLKVYLIPGDNTLNAHAYGGNCVSVNLGTLNSTDLDTLKAVLAHEISHTVNCDTAFTRALFCSVNLLVRALSLLSFVLVIIAYLFLLILRLFRLRLGALIFSGTATGLRRMISLTQRSILWLYRTVISIVRRKAEYRCDKYAGTLGYGNQLAHFLAMAESGGRQKLTLTQILYRSHPPTKKRIARLKKQARRQAQVL
jgi:Zn-dependent protease with chaperone function